MIAPGLVVLGFSRRVAKTACLGEHRRDQLSAAATREKFGLEHAVFDVNRDSETV
jgi:hypothetical protein